MIPLVAGGVLVLLFVLLRARRHGKDKKHLRTTPLAGYDTGVRSPRRVPGRYFTPHRGF